LAVLVLVLVAYLAGYYWLRSNNTQLVAVYEGNRVERTWVIALDGGRMTHRVYYFVFRPLLWLDRLVTGKDSMYESME
jgi:hypothetical protein